MGGCPASLDGKPVPNQLNILFVHGITEIGGAERELLRILTPLTHLGYHPIIACPAQGPLVQELVRRHIEHRTVVLPAWHKFRSYMQRASSASQLHNIIRNVNPVALHVNDIWWVPQTLRAVGNLQIPIVAHVRQEIEARKARHYELAGADLLLAVSNHIRDALINAGMPAARVMTVYSGLDLGDIGIEASPIQIRSQFGIPTDAPLLGTLASLFTRKGHEVMLRALPRILCSFPGTHYLVIGRGDAAYEAVVRAHVKKLGLEQHVHFAGFQESVFGFLEACTVYVHPVLMEGFGLAVLEAMAMGRPVVATTAGGLPEVVRHGETGLLVPPGDDIALAEAIMALLRDPVRADSMGQAGRVRVSALFSKEVMMQQLKTAYELVLRSPHAKTVSV
jgi:glycosyltransferase involved in cell wall biosynthesis